MLYLCQVLRWGGLHCQNWRWREAESDFTPGTLQKNPWVSNQGEFISEANFKESWEYCDFVFRIKKEISDLRVWLFHSVDETILCIWFYEKIYCYYTVKKVPCWHLKYTLLLHSYSKEINSLHWLFKLHHGIYLYSVGTTFS